MRMLDAVAFAAAILAIFAFLASSGQFRVGRWLAGLASLTAGAILFTAGLAAGAVSVGTEGYQPVRAEGPTVVANITAERLAGDSIHARITSPRGLTRTFRLSGTRLFVDAKILHWKTGTLLFGRDAEYELIELVADFADDARIGTTRPLETSKPVDVFDLASRFTSLDALVRAERGRAEIPLRPGATFELRISADGLTAEPIG
jgi:hypothetical protein